MNQKTISENISLGIRIAALFIVIIFFLPTVCVSCQSETMEISAFNMALGNFEWEEDDDEAGPLPLYFLIIIFAIVILVKHNKDAYTSLIATIGNIIMMVVMKIQIQTTATKEAGKYADYIQVKTTTAYFFHMLLCVCVILALLIDKYIINNPENQIKITNYINRFSRAPNSDFFSTTCFKCGKPILNNCKFCSNCGSVLPPPDTENNAQANENAPNLNDDNSERINKVKSLYRQGLITKEEYDNALLKINQEV